MYNFIRTPPTVCHDAHYARGVRTAYSPHRAEVGRPVGYLRNTELSYQVARRFVVRKRADYDRMDCRLSSYRCSRGRGRECRNVFDLGSEDAWRARLRLRTGGTELFVAQ